MKTKLKSAVTEALKQKNKEKVTAIRGVLAAVQYEEMQKNVDELEEADIVKVIKSEIKKRNEELEFAEKANRPETVNQLNNEISFLNEFLPKQLSETELETIITELKTAEPEINLGGVMKKLNDSHAGQFDGKMASSVARKVLS